MKRLALVGMVGVAAITAAIILNHWYDEGVQPNDRAQRNLLTPRPKQTAASLPVQPTLDVVRTNESGDMVIAGRALPNSEITVLDDGQALGSVIADERGDWVFLPRGTLAPGPRQIGLLAKLPDGRILPSERTVKLVLPGKG